MISTPDVALQDMIRTALMDNQCPVDIIEQLMENAHERHWPEGLATLGNHRSSLALIFMGFTCRNSTG